MNRSLVLALLASAITVFTFAAEKPRELVVYFPHYRYQEGVEPELYGTTELVLFSATPKKDGTVDFSRITPGLLEVARTARAKHQIAVTVCVGGWGHSKVFADAVSTEENRKRFAEALQNFCRQHELAGVDIDWEYPKGDIEIGNFVNFLETLSKGLRSENRRLSIALAPTRMLPEPVYQHIDGVNLMCYQPWSVEPYEAWLLKSMNRALEAGVPPDKLVLGLPFFSKEKAGERRAVSYKRFVENGETAIPESEHGFWPMGPKVCDMRLALVEKHNLRGVMVWDYGHDSMSPDLSLLRDLSIKMRPGTEEN